MSNLVIETDLKEILTKIDQRLERLEENMTTLKVSQARIEEKVDGLSKRAENIEKETSSSTKDISDLKGAKSLIIPIVVAVTTSLLTLLIRAIPNP